MDQNSQKWSQKGYQSLPFAVSVRRSFEQFHNLNKRQGSSRIIQSHHLIEHASFNLNKAKVF